MGSGTPKNIGRYTIERLLGSGAMGFVFLGRDPELDRAVAIKTVRDLDLGEQARATFLERFRNEARAAARVHHPCIVQIYDVGDDAEAGPYLVFEYVAGSTLKKVLTARGALPPEEVIRLAGQIADALAAAHAHGIIHRDIKPDNLLVTPSGDVKLADFGVARVPNAALTREGQFLGTPCYAAPETLMQGLYGPESDMFSFAAVLYEAVSGVRAFPGNDAMAVAHQVCHDTPKAPSEAAPSARIPRAVDRILMQGLSKEPRERPKSPHALAEALVGAYASAGVVDPVAATRLSGGSLARPAPSPSRGGGWTYAALLGLVLLVGVGLVAAYARPDTSGHVDAGTGVGVVTPPPVTDAGRSATPAARDAGPAIVVVTAAPDAGAGTTEPPPLDVTGMSRHQREEASKDAVADALRLLEAGDSITATQKIRDALVLDPGNDEAMSLARRLGLSP